jgi:SPP1 family predicted phage head-tail adaptor
VTIEQPIRTRTPSGAFVDDWEPFLEDIWAAIEPISGRKGYTASQVTAEATTRIRMRYRPGVTAKMRVKYVSNVAGSPTFTEYYDIETPVEVVTRRRELHLECKKRDAQGFRAGT